MMTANEIRKNFLEFFKMKGHTIVASDSLVPKDDPTVLFTTAGMQQFKRQFLGQIDNYTRAATCQKCLRTDDLDQVGRTAFHHTFFEMLGNFSFGDYFKKEAITWGWEFLTQKLNIPVERLWASVYKEDREAEEIWLKKVKIPSEKLVRLGDKSNFWPSEAKEKGPNGPCGSCSEIFYDYGVNPNCKSAKCDPSCDCGRFSEVWNLVFTQFNRKDGGVLEPLPNKNIDTGMGLERLVAVVQGKKSNYATDLFMPILDAIEKEIEVNGVHLDQRDKLVIADHIRAIVFGIADGVIPSNGERGYVIKKLIVETTDLVLNYRIITGPSIYRLVPYVISVMNEQYPELVSEINRISSIIKKAEEAYIKVRTEILPLLERDIDRIKRSADSKQEQIKKIGLKCFIAHDTFGVTESTILSALNATGILGYEQEDIWKTYREEFREQQERSRATSKMTGDVFTDVYLGPNLPKTKFLGYEHFQSAGTILKMFKNNKKVESVDEGEEVKIILDQTPFYAESGGQIGDTGTISKDGATIRVNDTQKIGGVFIHAGTVIQGTFRLNDVVQAQIDAERRLSIMRNHTATHLLQAALREVLGAHVQQQGSLVAEDRLRFDFTHHQAISKDDILQIESLINTHIMSCDSVDRKEMPLSEAKASGALAFFAEKYGETVRVVSIDGYSQEFCGGTHLNSTGQVGLFKIISESAIAQGIRRVEAATGKFALELIKTQEKQLEKIAQTIKAPLKEVAERVDHQTKRLRELEKEMEHLRFEVIKNFTDDIIQNAPTVKEVKIITSTFKEVDAMMLRKVSDLIKQKTKSAVVALGSAFQGSAFILVAVTDDLVQKGLKANELIKLITPTINGTGGGRPQLAQAGSKEVAKLDDAINQAKQLIMQNLQCTNYKPQTNSNSQ